MAKKTETSSTSEQSTSSQSFAARQAAQQDALHISGIAGFLFSLFIVAAILGAILMDGKVSDLWIGVYVVGLSLIGTLIMFSLKVARQWEKAVVLRLGRFHALRGPGLFWLVPVIDTTPVWIDHRVMVTPFNAEKTLTKAAT